MIATIAKEIIRFISTGKTSDAVRRIFTLLDADGIVVVRSQQHDMIRDRANRIEKENERNAESVKKQNASLGDRLQGEDAAL